MRRYEPYHGYFDQWDEEGGPMMREAKNGGWVKFEHARDTVRMYEKRIERLKAQLKSAKGNLPG